MTPGGFTGPAKGPRRLPVGLPTASHDRWLGRKTVGISVPRTALPPSAPDDFLVALLPACGRLKIQSADSSSCRIGALACSPPFADGSGDA